MATRDDTFQAIFTEVLHHGRNKAATYHHIECKTGGIDRMVMVYCSLRAWVQRNPDCTATYMFVNTADCTTAQKRMEDTGTSIRRGNPISLTAYASWVDGRSQTLENRGHLIFVMDMGFGVRTGNMTLAAIKMLHDMQELLRGKQTGTTITWMSISHTAQALISSDAGNQVGSLH